MAEQDTKSGGMWWIALCLGAGGTFLGGRLLTEAPKPAPSPAKEAVASIWADGPKIWVQDPAVAALADIFPEAIQGGSVQIAWQKPREDADGKVLQCLTRSMCPPPKEEKALPTEDQVRDLLKGRLGSAVLGVIATVPDPDLTVYGQYADASTEALQRATETGGLNLLRAILPWQLENDPKKPRPAQPRFSGRPGLLLFRGLRWDEKKKNKRPVYLLTYVVGESPIFGVDRVAMTRARTGLEQWTGKPITIVGPTFSGSLQSIADVMKGADRNSWLISPSATDRDSFEALDRVGLKYRAAVQHDKVADCLATQFLGQRKLHGISFLSLTEANTAFGQGFADQPKIENAEDKKTEDKKPMAETAKVETPKDEKKDPPCPVTYPHSSISFPMNIARLREAYQNDPDLRSFGSVRSRMPKSQLELRSHPVAEPKDSAPVFQPALAAQVQEAVLDKIATDVETQSPDYVVIAASDTLDSMFLASFMRSRFPGSRQLTYDADLLFTTQSAGVAYDGLIAVTKYPLLLGTGPLARTPFPSRQAQGTYDAMQSALSRMGTAVPTPITIDPLANWEKDPLWLTVVGSGAYWPLAKIEPKGGSEPDQARLFARLPSAWRLLQFTLIAIWLSLLAAVLLARASAPECPGWVKSLLGDRQLPKASLPIWMRMHKPYQVVEESGYALFGLLVVFAAGLTARGVWEGQAWWSVDAAMVLLVAGLVSVEVIGAGVLRTASVRWASLGALAATLLTVIVQSTTDSAHQFLFFAYRSMHLGSGLSPFLLLLLLSAPVIVCLLLEVVRRRHHAIYLPMLPEAPKEDELLQGQLEILAGINQLFDDRKDWSVALGAATATVLLVFTLPFSTLEGWAFDALCLVLFHGVVLLAIWNFAFFWRLWLRLTDLLSMLELHQMRGAFDRINGDTWADIWKSRGPHRVRQLIVRTVDGLRTVNVEKGYAEREEIYKRLKGVCRELLYDSGQTKEIDALERAEVLLKGACENLSEHVLVPKWRFGKLDELAKKGEVPDLSGDQIDLAGVSTPEAKKKTMPTSFSRAEEVFALRYLALIRYLMSQMRLTTNYVLFAIVCLGLSIISYPLQPVRSLQTVVTIMFLFIGTAVVWVFLQLEVDEILSRLSDTVPGKVNTMFFARPFAQLGVPLLLVLSTQFPELGRTLFFWVQQAFDSLR